MRFAPVTLKRPNRGFSTGLPKSVKVQLVDIREVSPLAGESPIHWRLLTTRPVEDVADTWRIAELYRKRWAIEKTGPNFIRLKRRSEGCSVFPFMSSRVRQWPPYG